MKLSFRLPVLLSLVFLTTLSSLARVLRVEVLSRAPLTASEARAGAPLYEKITARVYFAVRPADTHNRVVVDLDNAPRNAQGEVEFSSDLFLLRPLSKSNGSLLLEIPNRGGKGLLGLVDGGKADPAEPSELGDGWLLGQGFTFASLGWQWDVANEPGNLRLYAPVAHPARDPSKHIRGLLRDDFTPFVPGNEIPLGHIMGTRLGGTEYPVADPSDAQNTLTMRDLPQGRRIRVPRTLWSFAHTVDGKISPDTSHLRLESGFLPGKIYELVYAVQDPVVAGLGFAAVRDFVSYLKHQPDAIAPVKFAYAAGISQCGRFLRDFVYQGFNADEQNRMALDGILAHVGGAGRGSFNYRFAQPSRDAQPMSSIDYPTDIFPFTDLPETDPHEPQNGKLGLLDAARTAHVIPKIFLSHTSYEYWGRAASLIHTTADGTADMPMDPSVRIYFFAGLQHYSVPFPPQMGTADRQSQQLPSPLPIRWFWRAMIANMDAWVRTGTTPPPSRYPKIANHTLVTLDKLAFPGMDGLKPPADNTSGWDLDYGPNWRAGILEKQPPLVIRPYPALVPQVDENGNDRGGINLPEIAAPLATYTGWNFRSPAIGAPSQRSSFQGSFVPLPRTKADAEGARDSRPSIDSRYKSLPEYMTAFQKAVDSLVENRYILPQDAGSLNERARPEWEWFNSYEPAVAKP